MKKNTSEKLINLLGVAAGNAILALAGRDSDGRSHRLGNCRKSFLGNSDFNYRL